MDTNLGVSVYLDTITIGSLTLELMGQLDVVLNKILQAGFQ